MARKSLTKRILRSQPVQTGLAHAAGLYLRLVHATTRWTIECPPATRALVDNRQPFIACFWHGRLGIMRGGLPPGMHLYVLISGHRDGRLIARAVARLGVTPVHGSSRRNGTAAVLAIVQLLRRGEVVGITPDGPRGPRMRAKPGAIKAAQLAGVPLVPITAALSRQRILGTWDRFCLGLPFGRGLVVWGEPIVVPRRADAASLEAIRRDLEERLNALTTAADRRFGHAEVAPAPGPSATRDESARHARA